MSNSILTKEESITLSCMIQFLRNRGINRLCDRVERVKKNAELGVLSRTQFFTSVVRDAAFRAIQLASRENNGVLVLDFVIFTMSNGLYSKILQAQNLLDNLYNREPEL